MLTKEGRKVEDRSEPCVSPCYGVGPCYGASPCYSVSPCYGVSLCYGVGTCYVIFALVTRPECPKCMKDEVKRPPYIIRFANVHLHALVFALVLVVDG